MSETSRQVLNLTALTATVKAIAVHREMTMRDVASETGLSPSTLSRMSQGQKPDADGLVTLLAWLKADATAFALPRGHENSMESEANRDDWQPGCP